MRVSGDEKYAKALDRLIDAKDEIARLRSRLESAHALLDEWTSYHKAELRARTRELLDREADAADELMALVGAAEALAEDVKQKAGPP